MSFISITIQDAMEKIANKEILLPAIQREFVWKPKQIEMLFDSLMREYPINTFLFWTVLKKDVLDFTFYEVLDKYHETESRHNETIDINSPEINNRFFALLDGQQRLTSMYLALKGSYSTRKPRTQNQYEKKFLYLNLYGTHDDSEEKKYDFSFMTEQDAETENTSNDGKYWFKCGDVLNHLNSASFLEYLDSIGVITRGACLGNINSFYRMINERPVISYYEEKSDTLDKVLQIFIRVNSGGTVLTYSDLLLSVATAQWRNRNARDEITKLVDDLNDIGQGFKFNKDLVLKACLVFFDEFDFKFKAENFSRRNMEIIENNWGRISKVLQLTVQLISHFGYSKKTLTSNFSIIPIALFIFKSETKDVFHDSWKENRNLIKNWLSRTLLKGVFGGHSDNVYPAFRRLVKDSIKENKPNSVFPLSNIEIDFNGTSKSISFSSDDIESLLDNEYASVNSHSILSLIYGHLSDKFNYQQDHIHPKSLCTDKKLREIKISNENKTFILENFNKLSNIQLLEASVNLNKRDADFHQWVQAEYPDKLSRESYLRQNFIPLDASLELKDFVGFYNARKEAMRKKLKSILQAPIANT